MHAVPDLPPTGLPSAGTSAGTSGSPGGAVDGSLALDEAGDGPELRSEAALLRAARLGDQTAYEGLVDLHGPAMLRYARRLMGGDDGAKDVVQEAFVSAWKDLERFEGRSSVRTWLFRIVHRRAVDAQRVRRPVPVDDPMISRLSLPAPDDPLAEVLRGELLAALQVALSELPGPQRGVWLLREVEGLSYDEIADVMQLPVGSVRGHLHRGRRALAERMETWR